MIEATLKEIDRGAIVLKRLADDAKLPPVLFIKVCNAWHDIQEQMELVGIKQQESLNLHYEQINPNQFLPKSKEARIAHDTTMRDLLAMVVQLPRVKETIPWKLIEEAKIDPPLTPAEAVALAWLIELPDEQ
jgi:hypothetical protein